MFGFGIYMGISHFTAFCRGSFLSFLFFFLNKLKVSGNLELSKSSGRHHFFNSISSAHPCTACW